MLRTFVEETFRSLQIRLDRIGPKLVLTRVTLARIIMEGQLIFKMQRFQLTAQHCSIDPMRITRMSGKTIATIVGQCVNASIKLRLKSKP